eukprot:TRINITY_DN7852_c0_g1_i3.p1 TRINITY_DN7852_c0_g1~~TRINITY_DN7852_c0_g1_i3.p1  ORF type:complete len:102 (-),score=13.65 TRINITY_DN7852_c0_g1_i3:229-534(-)
MNKRHISEDSRNCVEDEFSALSNSVSQLEQRVFRLQSESIASSELLQKQSKWIEALKAQKRTFDSHMSRLQYTKAFLLVLLLAVVLGVILQTGLLTPEPLV